MTRCYCGCQRKDGTPKDGAKCVRLPAFRPITTQKGYAAAMKRLERSAAVDYGWGPGGALVVCRPVPFSEYAKSTKPTTRILSVTPIDPLELVRLACEEVQGADRKRLATIRTARHIHGLTLAKIAGAAGVTAERVRQLTTS